MTMRRHATQREILEAVKAQVIALGIFPADAVELCGASGYGAVVARAGTVMVLPACLVMPGAAQISDDEVRGYRDGAVILVVIGDFNAAGLDAGSLTVVDLVDALIRSFSPTAPGVRPVTIDDVVYTPTAVQPIDAGADRAVFALKLATVDTPQERSST
jgi:hypothetical protein